MTFFKFGDQPNVKVGSPSCIRKTIILKNAVTLGEVLTSTPSFEGSVGLMKRSPRKVKRRDLAEVEMTETWLFPFDKESLLKNFEKFRTLFDASSLFAALFDAYCVDI